MAPLDRCTAVESGPRCPSRPVASVVIEFHGGVRQERYCRHHFISILGVAEIIRDIRMDPIAS